MGNIEYTTIFGKYLDCVPNLKFCAFKFCTKESQSAYQTSYYNMCIFTFLSLECNTMKAEISFIFITPFVQISG